MVRAHRPFGADLRQRQITLRKLGAPAVHPVEDVDHHVQRLVRPSDLLDVEVNSFTPSSRLSLPTYSPSLGASAGCALRRVTNSPSPAFPSASVL